MGIEISFAKNIQNVDAFSKALSNIKDVNDRIDKISNFPVLLSHADIV